MVSLTSRTFACCCWLALIASQHSLFSGNAYHIGLAASFSTPQITIRRRAATFDTTRIATRTEMTMLKDLMDDHNDHHELNDDNLLYFLERSGKDTCEFKRQSCTGSERSLPGIMVSTILLSAGMMVFAFGDEAVAQSSSDPVMTVTSPLVVAISDIANDVSAVFGFIGDVIGTIVKLLYQVVLVVVPLFGKAIVAAFQAAIPAIREGAKAFFEYFQVATNASGDAAKPYFDEAVQVSSPYLKEVGSTMNDAASTAGTAVQSAAKEQMKTVNSAIQNVAVQAKTTIRR